MKTFKISKLLYYVHKVIQLPINILQTLSTVNISSCLMSNSLDCQAKKIVFHQWSSSTPFILFVILKKVPKPILCGLHCWEKAFFNIPNSSVNMPYLLPLSDSTVPENPQLEKSKKLIMLFLRNDRHVLICNK